MLPSGHVMAIASENRTWTIALIGNPNTGKSTLFGALSGVRQRVGNYPGVTVEKKLGEVVHDGRRWILVDLPGTYSLAPRSPDEMVTVDVLLGRRTDVQPPDVVICVVAASNLTRNLYLVSQVLELGRPVIVALSMGDLAEADGLTVDAARLSRQLGIPVVPIQAQLGEGLEALKQAVEEAGTRPAPTIASPFPSAFRQEVEQLAATLTPPPARYLIERLLLDSGSEVEAQLALGEPDREQLRQRVDDARARLAEVGCRVPEVETTSRYAWIADATDGVVEHPDHAVSKSADRLDAVLTHKVWGSLILAAVLLLTFSAVFALAQIPMDWIDAGKDAVSGVLEEALPDGPIRSLLVKGIIGGIGAVVIFLPQIFILFFILTALEECGYLSRAAYLMDKIMVRVGLSGKSFIPLLSSFACAIPGVMATRVIENRRDRLTTILIAPLMSCSARLPVYTLMIAAFIPARSYLGGLIQLQGLTMFAMYSVGVVVAAAVALILKRTLLRSAAPVFLMEMPAYQWPSPRVIIYRMFERGLDFLQNAGTIIFAVSILMWGALYYPRISADELKPLLTEKARIEAAIDTARAANDGATAESLAADLGAIDHKMAGEQERRSFLGRAGKLIEPVVRPLGWDWRIGSAVLASFPAREVVVATMGVIFDVGEDVGEGEGEKRLTTALQTATWPETGKPLFNIPVALSVMVFFALCAQCVSTLAVIGRETQSWIWPTLSFTYMTVLAYIGAFLAYHVGMLFVS
ncbi:ferrous iron transport protein B [Paludisphaera borealis]|uniref:Ferrous iron transport protein B n=1 Tax=Paludisphaera borealis TaxID=1387353 RepID=A0A1U7CKB0_9BACT|nr:ferrous iron transport protein B [Paludisphaera borealis]APW59369.1 Ferrous iron transport protein B [Paludisphaera borealis]